MPPSPVADRLAAVRSRIASAARAAGRDPGDVRLLVATKTQDADDVRAAVDAGVDLIGENRVQELVAKAPALADRVAAGTLEVHMIGHLQRNKINQMLATATGVETVDGRTLAEALSTRCVRDGRTLDVMVQVNVSGEGTKSGVAPDDAVALAVDVAALPGLRLTGFMTIGARLTPDGEPADDATVRAGFARLRAIRDEVLASGAPGTAGARELSMGMSTDLDLAIAEGATIVRVGTAIFGPRDA
ncbi:YggS family pyridoxal phosphate-dependent enzyme [Myceligenerans pegani]|uniref:Pyridoxal phosphate homeostasis protein n=1 Tax=Myceligenerans pegani TaxID=2776917 RepID=A0ABR9N3V8_9MICO|nr:YggS family pyridoxal phosphate-dependent enzyme [Myceligenerans sp. TRM 65318]MBE1878020.1 YggS family pyridoxal phosphate-dependent enzyme [Myceligenerans sp. TRM 65318]MBE3020291.1 YggS family pyridoxal phosphate-dependent enzyme [Myceligenerans sp. TRM 65318]